MVFYRVFALKSLLKLFNQIDARSITMAATPGELPDLKMMALFGFGAVLRGKPDSTIILPLYCAGVCWTLVYDTIYAHQDKEDDLRVGVKSTALRFGSSTKGWITGFGAACVTCLTISGYNAMLAWPFYPFLAAAATQMGWQILTVDISNREDCNKKFVSNKWFGALIFGGILFGRLAS
ncbi:hypothetical protein HPP92_014779 [Vanilla planifolia]|uniref:Uncharacterized protein n=1 Tax=Vanilla planifolia TaxID=51239 RepID=A0A835QQ76_VANPL|nr:hypothetical protein HPP92_014779 [Vanilla planifolia]